MKSLAAFLFLVFSTFQITGQEFVEKPPAALPSTSLFQYGVEYPRGVNGQTFYNGAINYHISSKLSAELKTFYAKFGTHEQLTSSLIFKWYVSKRIYLFAGAENEYDINQLTGKPQLLRVNLNLGVGYEVNPNFLIELGYHPQIGAPKIDLFGRPSTKQNSFSLRARF